MSHRRIALYGLFGVQNIGNECTLQAALANVRELAPEADLICLAADPQRVSLEHGIPAIAIEQAHGNSTPSANRPESRTGRVLRLLWQRLPLEVSSLARILRSIGHGTTLAVTGTGMLEEDSASTSGLFNLLKWIVATRVRGGRVIFVSVGAGPIESSVARRLCRVALGFADYVSYRDERSKRYMASIGADTRTHCVFPDLAFSLPAEVLPSRRVPHAAALRVGVGVIDDSKFPDAERYKNYLDELAIFVLWLFDRQCEVRVMHGDRKYDAQALSDLREMLRARGVRDDDPRIDMPQIADTRDLLRVIADVDVVVASRYHNVILSLLLGRPAIAISYHFKFAALLEALAMQEYCIELADVKASALTQRFTALTIDLTGAKRVIAEYAQRCRPLLAAQYVRAFQSHGWKALEPA
jgi:polysaccharide pyruvyl transferase WcaK-like protein